jgi:hypothetical protein
MKYLKTYDSFSSFLHKYTKYKRNMYVLTTNGEICKIGAVDHGITDNYWMETPVGQEFFNNDPYINDDIVREATPEEIEQYELEKNANKYNL